MKSGVYKIENIINGKIYIGSSVDLDRRRKQHFVSLLYNKHHNAHLQASYNKWGESNFEFIIMEIIEDIANLTTFLLEREQYYMDFLKPEYNICRIAGAFGMPHTEETKQKISASTKGVKKSAEHSQHIKEAQKGKILSEEHKQNLSIAAQTRNNEAHMSKIEIDGIVYQSLLDASDKLGIKYDTLQKRLSNPNFENYKYLDGRINKVQQSIKKGMSFKNAPVIIDNIEYSSALEASRILNIKVDTVKYRIASKTFNNYNLLYNN